MFIRDAKAIADRLLLEMAPSCRRVEIAGSIRRGKQEVKDIEIVAIPEWGESSLGLFPDGGEKLNKLLSWAFDAEARGDLQWIKTGTREVVPWEPKRDSKYWRALLREGIKLDLFLTTEEQWGLIHLIRTGCAEFSQGVMTYARQRTGYRVEGGVLRDRMNTALETYTEQDVFDALGLDYVEPQARTDFNAVRRRGAPVFPPDYGIKRMEAMS